jgi:hypothetical protein
MPDHDRTQGRCPDCQSYCDQNPLSDRFYCSTCGWFDADDATHIVNG